MLDGTSKTIAIGEAAYLSTARVSRFGFERRRRRRILFKTHDPFVSAKAAFPLSDNEIRQLLPPDSYADDVAFGWHPGGVYFGFVDGSARFLSTSIDLRTYALLGDRMDGRVINEVP